MVMKERDEELALFLEMRRREKEEKTNNLLLLNKSEGLDVTSGTNPGTSPVFEMVSSAAPPRKTAAERFLDSENDKSDYDWLLTPPGTPLFPSLEMESQKTVMSQLGMSNARPTALKSRRTNIQEEPAARAKLVSKGMALPSGPASLNAGNKRPLSSGGPKSASRPATPTARPILPAITKSSRPSTPTSRATLPSTKPTAAASARSSTPTRTVARSSTPNARPSLQASKSTSRSATPTRRPATPSSAPGLTASLVRSSSVPKLAPTTSKNPVPSRGISPTVKSTPWKPSEMPGFSLDAPPNLRTSLPERPASASRGRPGGPSSRSSSVESGSSGRPRQQSCSPAKGRASNGTARGSRISIPIKSRAHANGSDVVNPVLMGTKMVERVVNMRKLPPPKQNDSRSNNSNSTGKSSSLDSTGFGRTLSKKSLDMALRHMDIRRSISGNPGSLRPLMTNVPASSMYSVRSGGSTKSRTASALDSPLATSSNASSEPSVNNKPFFVDGTEIDGLEMDDNNEFGSVR